MTETIHGVPVGTITLEVTRRCHRRCAFCYVAGLREPDAVPEDELGSEELVSLVADLMRETGCRTVQLSGGEPLLRTDLLDIVRGLREQGAKVSMITEGGPLDAPLARALAGLKVAPIQPTLLAGDAALHDGLRGRGSFRETTRAIATAVDAGLPVTVCMVVTRRNWREAGRVAELAFALGAKTLGLSRFCPAGDAAGAVDDLLPSAEQLRQACDVAAAVCLDTGLRLASVVTVPACVWPDGVRPPLPVGVCSLMGSKTTVTVGPDGSVRSCTLSQRVVGNLRDDAWGELAERLWRAEVGPCRETVPQVCAGCVHWSRCLGGCRLAAECVLGGLAHPDPLAPVS